MEKVINFVEKAFGFFDLEKCEFSVEESEKKLVINVQADDKNVGYLIGYKGEGLFSLQKIINYIFYDDLKGKKLFLNINGYLENREEKIKNMAILAANKVVETKKTYFFDSLNSYDRLLVHQTVSQDETLSKKVKTYSEGEGKERVLILSYISNEE
jgi:spoIIIJ-associated protein